MAGIEVILGILILAGMVGCAGYQLGRDRGVKDALVLAWMADADPEVELNPYCRKPDGSLNTDFYFSILRQKAKERVKPYPVRSKPPDECRGRLWRVVFGEPPQPPTPAE